MYKTNAILYTFLCSFSTSNKIMKKSKQVSPKSFCHISVATEKHL